MPILKYNCSLKTLNKDFPVSSFLLLYTPCILFFLILYLYFKRQENSSYIETVGKLKLRKKSGTINYYDVKYKVDGEDYTTEYKQSFIDNPKPNTTKKLYYNKNYPDKTKFDLDDNSSYSNMIFWMLLIFVILTFLVSLATIIMCCVSGC